MGKRTATHTDYKHPRHLRVVEPDGTVLCYSPSCSDYAKLARPGLPKWTGEPRPKKPWVQPTLTRMVAGSAEPPGSELLP